MQFTGFKLFYPQRHEEGRRAADAGRSAAPTAAAAVHPVSVIARALARLARLCCCSWPLPLGAAVRAIARRTRSRCASTTTHSTSGCCRGIVPTRSTRAASTSPTTAATRRGGRAAFRRTPGVRRVARQHAGPARARDRAGHLHAAMRRRLTRRGTGRRGRTRVGCTSSQTARAPHRRPLRRADAHTRRDRARRRSHGSRSVIAHGAAPAFNRPTDWSRTDRVRARCDCALSSTRDRSRRRRRGHSALDLIPRVGGIGRQRDHGRRSRDCSSRIGWHLPHPWLPHSRRCVGRARRGRLGRSRCAQTSFSTATRFTTVRASDTSRSSTRARSDSSFAIARLSLAYRAVSDSRAYAAAHSGIRGRRWSAASPSIDD